MRPYDGFMRAVVIYESLTGNTKKAAHYIGAGLTGRGWDVAVCPVNNVDLDALQAADLVVVGSWTDGVFVVGQRPGRAGRLRNMPAMAGKRTVVFVTYALHAGKVLDKMTALVESLGADVVGGMLIRRDDLAGGSNDLVDRVLQYVVPAPV
jgi:flavorubredoxin